MVADSFRIFWWEDGGLTVSGWGLAIITALVIVLFAFAERGE